MKKLHHDKLVRDNIIEILEARGIECDSYIADQAEYQERLKAKLQEECFEYLTDETPEELADVLEVLYALAKLHGLSSQDLENLRSHKSQKRGSFDKRIILVETKEDHH